MNENLKLPDRHSKWLSSKGLQKIFDVLEADGEEARVNGGAVRNSMLGERVDDIDVSTTLLPQLVLQRLKSAKIKAIATGLAHGTVTAVIDKQPFEITTLRRDVESDGRHAVVEFGRDWDQDARRRDLTMNALYCDRRGKVYDPMGGHADLMARNVRFIGEAGERIEEDYLRILRFFRFFAQYGSGRPDSEGLKACARLKDGISQLSVERVWMELKKILVVKDPSRALLWMRTTGVLGKVLPEGERWGIDFIGDMISAERDLQWPIDKMARLQVIVAPTVEKMNGLGKRLRLSKAENRRIVEWADAPLPNENISDAEFGKELYHNSQTGVIDRIRNEVVRQRHRARDDEGALVLAQKFNKMLKFAQAWQRPIFPIKGRDLEKAGIKPGQEMGEILSRLESKWVEGGFELSKAELLKLV